MAEKQGERGILTPRGAWPVRVCNQGTALGDGSTEDGDEEDLIERMPAGMRLSGAMMLNASASTDTFEIYKSVQTNLRDMLSPRTDQKPVKRLNSTKPAQPMSECDVDVELSQSRRRTGERNHVPASSSNTPRRRDTQATGDATEEQNNFQSGSNTDKQDGFLGCRLDSREVNFDSDDTDLSQDHDFGDCDEDELATLEKVHIFEPQFKPLMISRDSALAGFSTGPQEIQCDGMGSGSLSSASTHSRTSSRSCIGGSGTSGTDKKHALQKRRTDTRPRLNSGLSSPVAERDHASNMGGDDAKTTAKIEAWTKCVTLELHRREQFSLTMEWLSTLVDTYTRILSRISYELHAWYALLHAKVESLKSTAVSLLMARERAAVKCSSYLASMKGSKTNTSPHDHMKEQEVIFHSQVTELACKSHADFRAITSISQYVETLRKQSDASSVQGEANKGVRNFDMVRVFVDPSEDQLSLTAMPEDLQSCSREDGCAELEAESPASLVSFADENSTFERFFEQELNLMDSIFLKDLKLALLHFRAAERLESELLDQNLCLLLEECNSLCESLVSEDQAIKGRLRSSDQFIDTHWSALASQYEAAFKGDQRFQELKLSTRRAWQHPSNSVQSPDAANDQGARTVKNASAFDDTWLKELRYRLACDSQSILVHSSIVSLRRSMVTAVFEFEQRRRPAVLRIAETLGRIEEELKSEQALAQALVIQEFRATKRYLDVDSGAFDEEAWRNFRDTVHGVEAKMSPGGLTGLHEHGHTLDEEHASETRTKTFGPRPNEQSIVRALHIQGSYAAAEATVGLERGGMLKLLCNCHVLETHPVGSTSLLGSGFVVKATVLKYLSPGKQQQIADLSDRHVLAAALAHGSWSYVLLCLTLDEVVHVIEIPDSIMDAIQFHERGDTSTAVPSTPSARGPTTCTPGRASTRKVSSWNSTRNMGERVIREILVDHYARRENDTELPATLLQPKISMARRFCSASGLDDKTFRVREKYTKRGISRFFRKDVTRVLVFETTSSRDMRDWLSLLDNPELVSSVQDGLSQAKLQEHDRLSQGLSSSSAPEYL
ncbi:hypothetical protein FVE85_2010 [Porphyridium purpureum]|uniref:PH domain-containing protein n=1 Tax=Porphyridium purpureum TaxID=35688 RepID=A0A5J4YXI1_PORPP|nr:hypothetical protein FVE85_2010 [Porphyridium purpureum]|eukprot:POR1635..scf209_3